MTLRSNCSTALWPQAVYTMSNPRANGLCDRHHKAVQNQKKGRLLLHKCYLPCCLGEAIASP